jgi:Asp-tRNA(Asn)/Glu-tRNA(Gln) amidotransferase A subunit family amidase
MKIVHLPATELVTRVASGACSAAELVTAHLQQIALANPALNAFVQVREEDALTEAAAQDAAAGRGLRRGPLGGLPITVKSAIGVGGMLCETGARSRAGRIASADATLVRRLRAAGAIVIGTTNVAEMLMAYESDNPLYGRTANPWDATRTAGGSSGGEAAAISAGCSSGGVGSDGGGSIRVPAHFCGICGLKPTPGRIPSTGHQPSCAGPFALIGVVGPMARTMGDVSLLLHVMAGADWDDPMAAPFEHPAAGDPADVRIGFFEHDEATPVTRETADAVAVAARAAASAGYRVERFLPAALDRARELWGVFFAKAGAALLHDALHGAEQTLPILEEFASEHSGSLALQEGELLQAWLGRDEARAGLLQEMERYRVLICPVSAVPAFRHGEREWRIEGQRVSYLAAMSYTQWFNILGNPAAVVPVGRSPEGLPIGVQVVGRPYEEQLVIAVASAIERECGTYAAPPFT